MSGDNDNLHNTTNFHNDAGIRDTTLDAQLDLSPRFYKNPEEMTQTDLAFYLGRPTRIQTKQLTASDTATTFTALAMPKAMLTLPIYADKPRGRYGFRATMVFRLVINAERFQQGRYMLTYCPLGGSRYGTSQPGNAWVNKHSATLVQRSQLPKVEFDLATDTEVTLKIPYASIHDFYQFNWCNDSTGFGMWGVLRLFPYEKLVSASGSVECDYTIYGHFEDIEFVGFSTLSITPQSGDLRIVPQSGSLARTEQKKNDVGPVESMAVKVKRASTYLTPVPLLSDFATSVGWAADIAAGIASVFGWSSPMNVEKVSRFQTTNMAYMGNINKVDNAIPLAATTDNEVAVAPGFSSTNVDELDIVSLAKISAYHKTISWSTSQTVGDTLGNINIDPSKYYTTVTNNTVSYNNYTPICWVSNYFKYWRGSITVKFKIVKTEFHSGRVAIAYYPNNDTTWTLDNSDYVHREIIDIRYQNEISITIPWTSPTTYKQVAQTNGYLVMMVVDRLVAPATVSDTVKFIVEVAGGPDIEFAAPARIVTQTAAPDFTVQSADPFTKRVETTAISKMVGAASEPKFQLDTSQLCIGERITSFRQLLKRYAPVYHADFVTAGFYRVLPFGLPTLGTSTGTDSFTIYGDLYAELGNIFMFSRGGVRFKLFPGQDTLITFATTLSRCKSASDTPSYDNIAMCSLEGTSDVTLTAAAHEVIVSKCCYTYTDTTINKLVEVDVPQYYLNKSRNNAEHVVANGYIYNPSYATDLVLNFFGVNNNNGRPNLTSPRIFRAGSDDCNFGLFVSVPPFKTNPS